MKVPQCPKFDPLIVIVTSLGLPTATVEGEIEEIDGVGAVTFSGVCPARVPTGTVAGSMFVMGSTAWVTTAAKATRTTVAAT